MTGEASLPATTRAARVGTLAAASSSSPPASVRASSQLGLHRPDGQFNQRVAAAQQATAYLERFTAELQALRTAVSGRLSRPWDDSAQGQARRREEGEALQVQIRRFDALWRERLRAAAGRLDNQLAFSEASEPRQRFTAHGLQMASLRSGGPELLTFSVKGLPRAASALRIDPSASEAQLAGRLDHALAPSGVRAELDASGELVLSIAERDWPAVRESIAIKGEGRRFPTGQFTPVRTAAEKGIVQPDTWVVDDPQSLRRALGEIVQAEVAARSARRGADHTLAEAVGRLQPTAGEAQAESAWSAQFAQVMQAMGQRADYRVLSALTPALSGIERTRVTALLSVSSPW